MSFMSGAAWMDTRQETGGAAVGRCAQPQRYCLVRKGGQSAMTSAAGIKPGLRSPDDLSWIDRLGMKTCITLGGGLALMAGALASYPDWVFHFFFFN